MGELDQGLHFLLVHAGVPPVVAFLHLLDRHNLARLPVHRFDHGAIRAVSYHLDRLVFIHFYNLYY